MSMPCIDPSEWSIPAMTMGLSPLISMPCINPGAAWVDPAGELAEGIAEVPALPLMFIPAIDPSEWSIPGIAMGLAPPMSMPGIEPLEWSIPAIAEGLPSPIDIPMLPISLISRTWRGRGAGALTAIPSRGAIVASTEALRSSVSTHSG